MATKNNNIVKVKIDDLDKETNLVFTEINNELTTEQKFDLELFLILDEYAGYETIGVDETIKKIKKLFTDELHR